jgi:hypothetical protein
MVVDPVVTVKNGSYVGLYNQQYNQDFFLSTPFVQVSVLSWYNRCQPADTDRSATRAFQHSPAAEYNLERRTSIKSL